MKHLLTFLLILACVSVKAYDKNLTGVVVSVFDGKTIELRTADNETYKIILYGIESPELSQPYGDDAKKTLERAVLKKCVEAQVQGQDRHGNHLAIVMVQKRKVDPRIELLKEGLAWTAEKNPLPELEQYRIKAKEQGKGLWQLEDPTPPWIYRRQQSMMRPKSS